MKNHEQVLEPDQRNFNAQETIRKAELLKTIFSYEQLDILIAALIPYAKTELTRHYQGQDKSGHYSELLTIARAFDEATGSDIVGILTAVE